MKRRIVGVGLVVLASALGLLAGIIPTKIPGNASINWATTNSYTSQAEVVLRNSQVLGLFASFTTTSTNVNTNTALVNITTQVSMDRINWVNYNLLSVAAASNTTVYVYTNMTALGAWPFFRVNTWGNAAPGSSSNYVVTNLYLIYSTKE